MKYLVNNLITDWKEFLDNEFKQSYLIKIDELLYQSNQIIYPTKENIFRCFNYFNIDDTRVVIFGQDPYHNVDQANGLAFSVSQEIKTPPSLLNIFKKLKIDTNITRTNSDLQDWAKQGVLLLNNALTVIEHSPESHSKIGWMEFVIHVIQQLNQCNHQIMFVLMGNHSKQLYEYIDINKHSVLLTSHPSPLSAIRCKFFEKDLFNKIDEFLKNNNYKNIKW